MRKFVLLTMSIALVMLLTACQPSSVSYENDVTTKSDSIDINRDNGIEVEAQVTMDAHDMNIVVIEVNQDLIATLRYTYSTDGLSGVTLGYFYENGKKSTTKLSSKKNRDYKKTWYEQKVEFKKGVNAIYLMGSKAQTVKMNLTVQDIDSESVLYAGLHLHV